MAGATQSYSSSDELSVSSALTYQYPAVASAMADAMPSPEDDEDLEGLDEEEKRRGGPGREGWGWHVGGARDSLCGGCAVAHVPVAVVSGGGAERDDGKATPQGLFSNARMHSFIRSMFCS